MYKACRLTHPAVVSAITAHQIFRVKVQLNSLCWDTNIGVIHKVGVGSVNGIHAGYGHILLPIGQVFDVTKSLQKTPKLDFELLLINQEKDFFNFAKTSAYDKNFGRFN